MAMPIVPRICRGRLYFLVTYALFLTVPLTCAVASEVRRLDIVELIDGGTATPELTPVRRGVE
jgi:hypothetical protein